MIRKVIQWPDPLLSRPSEPAWPHPEQWLRERRGLDVLIRDMIETMHAEKGCGLAAVQVGVPVALFVLDVGGAPEAFLNPTWTPWKGTQPVLMDEGCLSVLDAGIERYYRATVPRYERINVTYQTPMGSRVTGSFRGLKAQAFQHESEHLDGKIFLDHLPEAQRAALREKLR